MQESVFKGWGKESQDRIRKGRRVDVYVKEGEEMKGWGWGWDGMGRV